MKSYWTLKVPISIALIFAAALLFPFSKVSAQGTTEEFGQNRVQFKTFTWSFFESDHFITYFYPGGQDIGKYTIIYGEKTMENLEKQMEYPMHQRVYIMVYNNLSDLNQTNIGIHQEINNPGGMVKIIQNKIFIYFDGNHQHLERQIRQGLAQVLINHMVLGGNFQEVLQNAVLLNLPDWFTQGLASYIGENWNADMEDQLRDGILSGKYKKLNKLQGDDVRFVGHALWHYVEEKYGKSAVSNLLYLTRINRSLESGFLFVLGGSVKSVVNEWYNTQLARFTEQKEQRLMPVDSELVAKRPMANKYHTQVKLDGDGKHVGYVTNILGAYKVFVLDNEKHKQKRILKGGHKTTTLVTDRQYPLLAWSPDKKTLATIYIRRDKLHLLLYNVEKKKKKKANITKFQQIHDFRFTNDPNMLVMSAVNKGQSDIYTYQVNNTTTEQLTDDYYDDLDAAWVDADGRHGVLFTSNRPTTLLRPEKLDTTLLKKDFDVYFLDMAHRGKVEQLTHTEFTNEQSPMQYDSTHICWLSDVNGITNRYVGKFQQVVTGRDTVVFFADSVVTDPKWNLDSLRRISKNGIDSIHLVERVEDMVNAVPVTNGSEGILEQDVNWHAAKSIDMFRERGRFRFYIDTTAQTTSIDSTGKLKDTPYQDHYLKEKEKEKAALMPKKSLAAVGTKPDAYADSTAGQPKKNYYYQSDFNTAPEINVAKNVGNVEGEAPAPVFQVSRVLPYRVKFATDFVTAQVNNALIFNRYEPYQPGNPTFTNPDPGAMINLGISDLFEDYKIYGGFQIPFALSGSQYFLTYEDLKKRLDKRYLYYRNVADNTYQNGDVLPYYNQVAPNSRPANLPINSKDKTNYFEVRLNYPLDVTKRIGWYFAYRNDNYIYQANEAFTLGLPNYSTNWVTTKLEYVQDNTIKVATNLFNGIRFKVWAEIDKYFTIQTDTLLNNLQVPLPHFDDQYFGVFGLDFRYYQKIHRTLTWCNRIAAGTSYGTDKVLFYLGGVDSWLPPQFNTSTPVDPNANYAFQSLVTNMRGFDENVRNGNSYAVVNSEIRWPIFSYLINSNIKSQFVRDFMIIGFTDIGTAWEGLNPYNNNNPLFTNVVTNGSVTANVQYFRNPVVFGYGFGLRTSLLGYYMRLDIAWGRDSGITSGPKVYFSLSQDF